ncbi:hypothetical protein MTsPCn3_17810 [Erythrobacter sp. MTPC3]
MIYSQFDPPPQNRLPWNFAAKIGPKRPFNQKQTWAIRSLLDREKRSQRLSGNAPEQMQISLGQL